ncbi:MAG: ABC transporter ATP-binding protein [Treponema sp.]|jgi:spermidine/putrescine transport system ATP-binding protein|nr:ABC transporter ATP-binding protein [Treponema sp.]
MVGWGIYFVVELLRLQGIWKKFGAAPVLKGIDLSVGAGEFVTLLGPSGCGKTTTLRIIAGLETVDAGRIFLEGTDVTGLAPNRRNMNMVFQNYALFPHMNVAANVGYGLKIKKRPRGEIQEAVREALELVRLSGYGRRMPSELSGGQKQRVAVARALINSPRVLLLDEPLGALDLQLRRQMQLELKGLQQRLGISFIYITHDQEEALTMSDRIVVMRDGAFEQTGSPEEIYDRPRTSFVARFVGSANIIRSSAGLVAVRPEWVNLSPLTDPAASGSDPVVSGSDPAPSAGGRAGPGFPGTVTGKQFAGGQTRISVTLNATGEEITASRQGLYSPGEIGRQVWVSWEGEHAVPVEDSGGEL